MARTLGTGNQNEVPSYSNGVMQLVLAANTAQAVDMPASMGFVEVSPSAGVDAWVMYGSTQAAIPTTSTIVASSTMAVLNPGIRNVISTQATTGLSVISATSGYATLSFWQQK